MLGIILHMSVQTRVPLITRLRILLAPISLLRVCHRSSASMGRLSSQRSDLRILWLNLYPRVDPFVTARASPLSANPTDTHPTQLVDLRCVDL
ncbi:hypothetical protein EMPG_17237 [Blastomyces silverae]|uniref:Uncharacterized protein n=1 Tax=Blastomyces silverae TaxID=2060906 RepID=A0A0H1B855_9EURO|nr:hypothetical protein EMPG_17237 [Blastomyces silverae]